MSRKFLLLALCLFFETACARVGKSVSSNTPIVTTNTPSVVQLSQSVLTTSTSVSSSPVTQATPNQLNLVSQISRGTAEQIAWSPDGNYLAVVGSLGVTLYDASDLNYDRLLPSQVALMSLAFSPDSHQLAVAAEDGTIEIWAFPSGSLLLRITLDGNPIVGLGFSRDGTKLIAGTQGGQISVIDVKTASVVHSTSHLVGYRSSLTINAARGLVAVAEDDFTIDLLDINTLDILTLLKAHNDIVVGLAFSKDGTKFASASRDGALVLWNIQSLTNPSITKVIGAAELPQLRAPLYFWDPGMFQGPTDITWSPALVFSPENDWIMACALDGVGRVWRTTYNSANGFSDCDRSAVFSPDGSKFATLDPSDQIWINSYQRSNTFDDTLNLITHLNDFSGPVQSLTVSADLKSLLTSDFRGFHLWSENASSDWQQNEFLATDSQFETFYPASSSDPSMHTLIAGGQGGQISIWDGRAGQFQHSFSAHIDALGLNGIPSVEGIVYNPNGRQFASVGVDGDVIVWDAESLKSIFIDFLYETHLLAFDPSGNLLAYVGEDYQKLLPNTTVHISDLRTSKSVEQFPTATDVSAIAISPQDNVIAVGQANSGMELFSIPGANLLVQLNTGSSSPTAAIFMPDSRFLVIGTGDGSLQLWDLATRKIIAKVRGHQKAVTVLKLSIDASLLFSGSDDGTVKIWNLSG